MPLHSRAIGLQLPEQASDLRQRFADLVDGGCLGFGGTSGIDPLAEGAERDLRIANVRHALNAGWITLGRAIDLFLAEAIGERGRVGMLTSAGDRAGREGNR